MSIVGKAGEYGHNNPDFAFVDSNFIRGGGRVVANLTALYALASKVDQLKQNVTVVHVVDIGDGSSARYELVNIADITSGAFNPTAWAKVVSVPQPLSTTDNPTFGGVNVNGGIAITESGSSFATPPIAITNQGDTAGTTSVILDAAILNPGDLTKKKHFLIKAGVPTTLSGNYVLQLPEPSLGTATLATTTDIAIAVGAANHFRGKYASLAALQTAISPGNDGDYAIVTGSVSDQEYIWDSDHTAWVLTAVIPAGTFAGLGGSPSDNGALASALAAKVDVVSGYGLMSSSDQTKLNGIASGATANSAAAQSDVAAGTDNVKFLTSSLWTWIKTQVQTIAGIWNFSNGLQVGGSTVETQNNKDASSGYAGLTAFKINFKNATNTFTSFFTNSNTASRTYTFKDRNGMILDDTDAATFVDLSSNQTVAGNKTLTGLTVVQSATPEIRLITADTMSTKFQRTTVSGNNLFQAKNQVVQIGGVGKAIRFPAGSTGSLSANDTGLPTGTSVTFTYSFVVRAPSGTAGGLVIGGWGSVTYMYLLANQFGLQDQVGGSALFNYSYGTLLNDANWHSFIFTVNGTQGKLYIDGTLVQTSTLGRSYNMTVGGVGAYNIGPYGGSMTATMDIDQILFYNRVLSTTSGAGSSNEIAAIYNSGGYTATPPSLGLIRRYELEENTGNLSADTNPTGTQYTFTLVNSPSWLSVGIVPVSASATEATYMSSSDGISNAERGVATWGDFNGRNQQQGKWFQFFQGTNYPLVSNNSGQWLFNSANTVATLPTIGSTIDIAGNLTIGSYAGTVAPTNGLIVSGTTGLGTSSPSSGYILDMVGPARSQGIFTTYGTTPELRWTTSDAKFATSTRSATNNALTFSNNIQQAGGAGGCLNFLAANTQTVTVPTTGLSASEFTFTVSCVFKTTQTHGSVFYITSSVNVNYRAGIEFNGSTVYFNNNGGSGSQFTATINDGSWHLVMLVYSIGGNCDIYIDNNLKASNSTVLGTVRLPIGTITIGNANLSGSGFNSLTGSIAQFCMWTSALGTTDRNSLWAGGSFIATPPTAASTLVRDYEFQDGSGSFAHDNSSAAVNGTLVNSPTWMGPGNGIIAQSATTTSSTFLKVTDGVNANERGQVLVSDTLAGTRIQGYTIKYFVNNGIPFIADNLGNILISPSNASETTRSLSALGVAGGLSIGSTYAIANAAPTDGLLVQGKIGLGVTTTNSMLEIGGTAQGVGGTGIGLKSAPLVRATANNDYLVGADFTGTTYDINTNGTAIQSCTITNAGSGYVNGSYSCNFSNITGSGTGGQAVITVASGVVTNINTSFPDGTGSGYAVGNQLTITNAQLGGSGSGFIATVSVTRFTGVTTVNLRTNTFAPATNNIGSVGTTNFYYATIYGSVISTPTIQAKVTTLTFQGADGYTGAVMNTNSTGGNWTFNGTSVNAGWRVDVGAGTSGSLRANGAITATANLAQGVYFNNTLSPSANNDVLVGLDINPAINLLPTAITSLGSITGGSGYTNGTYNGTALTGGSGTGATANITVAGGVVTVVTLVNKGTGYAAGNTLSATITGGAGFSIPAATVGYTGVTPLSLRTSGDIQIGGKLSIPTGSNKSAGTATLVSGTVTISNTLVTANSIIMLSYRNPSGTIGSQLAQGIIVAGTSFVVNSLDTSSTVITGDNNAFNWWIIN